MKDVWGLTKELFSGWVVLLHLLLYFSINFLYIYMISKHVVLSVLLGLVGSLLCFYSISLLGRQLKKEQRIFSELSKYVSNVVFYLKTGKNVLFALEGAKESASDLLKKDIDKTIKTLKQEGVLDVAHFEKYNFVSLNAFHQILEIKYQMGGSVTDLFSPTSKLINFETTKRDELQREKKYSANRVYFMTGIVFAVPILLSLFASKLYADFLNSPITLVIFTVFYLFLLFNFLYLQKAKHDISVTL
ncbi:hypothetical protein E2L07_18200 [Halalkalibacterium halodurans]|uniref:hypothetical protein n=1 Tax=Halalkalibacterium halodurans TaxID=86665 RepID=UPI001067CF84|nr:hypothetical protein [Halalkalibacterium halodurans]TES48799.1 hypothetical protein E2L07_18200 [Halalkalibacterium halodurans]